MLAKIFKELRYSLLYFVVVLSAHAHVWR